MRVEPLLGLAPRTEVFKRIQEFVENNRPEAFGGPQSQRRRHFTGFGPHIETILPSVRPLVTKLLK
jgi:hypothetical protein